MTSKGQENGADGRSGDAELPETIPIVSSAHLAATGRQGEEKIASALQKGVEACLRYAAIGDCPLLRTVRVSAVEEQSLPELAALPRSLSGPCDQAARAAATA